MPLRKLRAPDDVGVWLDPDDPRLWPRMCALWRLSRRLFPVRYPPGVHRYRSIEEASRQAEEWQAAGARG